MEKTSKYGPGPADSTDEGYRLVKDQRAARRYQVARVYDPAPAPAVIVPDLFPAVGVVQVDQLNRYYVYEGDQVFLVAPPEREPEF